jgi:5-formyltetrahydrofolate cyclo-ligase
LRSEQSEDPLNQKAQLRKNYRQKLQNFLNEKQIFETAHINLNQHLELFLKAQKGLWAAFFPLSDEPQFIETLKKNPQIQWAFPKIENDILHFYIHPQDSSQGFLQNNSQLIQNQWGIWEPCAKMNHKISLTQLSGVLIPGLAFDLKGGRLGKGKGFYDKTFDLQADPLLQQIQKIGLCFEIQISKEKLLPMESHDLKMHHIISENGFY